jgi:hypothetical protein
MCGMVVCLHMCVNIHTCACGQQLLQVLSISVCRQHDNVCVCGFTQCGVSDLLFWGDILSMLSLWPVQYACLFCLIPLCLHGGHVSVWHCLPQNSGKCSLWHVVMDQKLPSNGWLCTSVGDDPLKILITKLPITSHWRKKNYTRVTLKK